MKVYVVVELFKGGKIPEIKGVYTDRTKAEEIKNDYRFAFIEEQNLIQVPAEKMQTEVYVVMELLKLNVPNIVAVFKNKALAEEMVTSCEYDAQVIKEQLI